MFLPVLFSLPSIPSLPDSPVKLTMSYVQERKRSKTFRYVFENGDVIDENTPVGDLSEANKDKPKRQYSQITPLA